jgi:hypothetical protein
VSRLLVRRGSDSMGTRHRHPVEPRLLTTAGVASLVPERATATFLLRRAGVEQGIPTPRRQTDAGAFAARQKGRAAVHGSEPGHVGSPHHRANVGAASV